MVGVTKISQHLGMSWAICWRKLQSGEVKGAYHVRKHGWKMRGVTIRRPSIKVIIDD